MKPLMLFALVPMLGWAVEFSPQVVKVTKTTPIFVEARSSSKVLADVDAGTVLVAREVSKKGHWILVEDEDGNRGWMPRDRSNLSLNQAPPVPDIEEESSVKKLDQVDRELSPKGTSFLVQSVVGVRGAGGELGLLLQAAQPQKNTRVFRYELSTGFECDYESKTGAKRFCQVPISFGLWGQDFPSYFASGPAVSALYRSATKNWGGGLGYRFAYLPFGSGLGAQLRLGIEWGGRTRNTLEGALGWIF
jgi:hypothetical protein